jgi:hypothetical protein
MAITRWDLLLLLVLATNTIVFDVAEAALPAVFILGDSTADVGTNSFLPSRKARADFPFNGIDFPSSTPTAHWKVQ